MSADRSDLTDDVGAAVQTAAVEGDIQDIVVIMEELQHQLRQARDANRGLQEQIEQEKARSGGLQKLANARAEEIERIKGKAVNLQEEGERLLGDLGLTNDERLEAGHEIRRLREQLDAVEVESRGFREQIQSLREASEASQGATVERLRTVEQSMSELQERIAGLESQLEERGRALASAQATVSALREEKEQLESKVTHLEHCRSDLDKVRSLMQAFALGDGEH